MTLSHGLPFTLHRFSNGQALLPHELLNVYSPLRVKGPVWVVIKARGKEYGVRERCHSLRFEI